MTVSFSDLFDIIANNTLSRSDLTTIGTVKNIHYGDVLIKFGDNLNAKDSSIPYIKDSNAIRNKDYLHNGDIIIADTAEDSTVGKSTEIYGITDEKIVSGLHTIPVRPKKHFASKFLGYYINSPSYHNQLVTLMQGIKVFSISKGNILHTIIAYPNIETQTKIVQMLCLVDRRIETQQKLLNALKSYKRGVFLELYASVTKREILFKEVYKRASEGGTPSTTNSEYYIDGKIPFAKIEDLTQRYLFSTKSFITEKGLQNSSAWLIPPNSIIFSNGATIGACSINKTEITTKQGILGFVPHNEYSCEYLYHYFTSSIFRKKVKAITTRGTMDCAYLKDMDYLKLEVPEYKVQVRMAEILNKIEDEIEKQTAIFQKLQYLKRGFLQQLFI